MKDTTLLQTAFLVAQESKCPSYRVGAVIAKNGRVISTGYNGTVSGAENPDEVAAANGWLGLNEHKKQCLIASKREEYSAWAAENVIHAEQNAILFAARSGSAIDGATIYCTLSPCHQCAKMIANSGIKRLVYCEEYPRGGNNWIEYLNSAGVSVTKIDKSELKYLSFDSVVSRCERLMGL